MADHPQRGERRTLKDQTAAAINRVRRYSKELPNALKHTRKTVSKHPTMPLEMDPTLATAPLAAAWLGHATILLRLGDKWIITDPVMSHRIGLPVGPVTIGLGRLLPAISLETLPALDLVLLSHAHFDHLDKPTLRRIANKDTHVVTAAGTGKLIPRGFGQVDELHWGKETTAAGLSLRALRPRHWGARVTVDKHRGYNSYVIDSPDRRVLYAGDTALSDCFAPLAADPKPTDLAIFGIGAYNPWEHAHATPEQVWTMFNQSGAKRLMPMHHSTFKLGEEPHDEPMNRLVAAAGNRASLIVADILGRVWGEGVPNSNEAK